MTTDQDSLQNTLTHEIIGAFYRVYNGLGFGFLESVYRRALTHELSKKGDLCQRGSSRERLVRWGARWAFSS